MNLRLRCLNPHVQTRVEIEEVLDDLAEQIYVIRLYVGNLAAVGRLNCTLLHLVDLQCGNQKARVCKEHRSERPTSLFFVLGLSLGCRRSSSLPGPLDVVRELSDTMGVILSVVGPNSGRFPVVSASFCRNGRRGGPANPQLPLERVE